MEWLDQLSAPRKHCLQKALSLCKYFPGLMAVVGSSANEKYPLGDDIDIALVGYDIPLATRYAYGLAQRAIAHTEKNMRSLFSGDSLDSLNYPLLKEVRFDLEDPVIAQHQQMVKGHGGSNIRFEFLHQAIPVATRKSEEYIHEYRSGKNGQWRTLIDLVVDFSWEHTKMDENITHWEKAMQESGQKYISLDRHKLTLL